MPFAQELRRVLSAVAGAEPVVLVAHSFGSLIAQAYLAQWPDAVAGMVLVDSSVPGLDLAVGEDEPVDGDGPAACRIDREGGARELLNLPGPNAPTVVIGRTPGRWISPEYEVYDEQWQSHQRSLAEQLGAARIVAADSDHRIHEEQPALVARVVDEVIRGVRAGVPLDLSPASVTAAGGCLERSWSGPQGGCGTRVGRAVRA